MSNPGRKVRSGEKLALKSRGIQSKPSHDLRTLRSLLTKYIPRQEVAALSHSKGLHPPKDTNKQKRESDVSSEAAHLEKFSITYRDQRCFSSHPLHKLFSDILTSLVQHRLCSEWIDHAPPESVLRVLTCLRLLIRDPQHQKILHELQGIRFLSRYMENVADSEQAFSVQQLVTLTYMFQKLSAIQEQRAGVMESGAHRTLVKLLSTTDSSVLLGALLALTTLAESPDCRQEIGSLPIVEKLLVILQEYDLLSKRMSAELLRLLSPVCQVRERVRDLEGLPVLLNLLYGHHLKLLWSVAWILVQLCQDPEARMEIRSWGGVQQLLRLLSSDRRYSTNRSTTETLASTNAAGRLQQVREEVENTEAMQSACCTVLTELSLDDTSAHHIVQENGVFIIAKLILPQSSGSKFTSLQGYAFRALRFLFSVERNRSLFKRLFPTDLFELFIDVGHYVRDLAAYEGLQTKVSLYTEDELDALRDGVDGVDQNRPPIRVINGYAVLSHLGTGAFGSVFKVRKPSGPNLVALKEVNLHNPAFGKDKKSRDSNVQQIISELTIVKEQMIHPNIVRYYKTFLEGERLYIVMELIEGVPLAEHFTSLKEKQQKFSEDEVWNIFIQMCLALRYLHKEKRIVHRDLSPNNIMLGEKDKVTITDFGLAKQKQENSKLTSVVGTILYSCPEVVKNEPYGEKADVWALGCILYQMATLRPPFCSSNMLSLASKIVEAAYEPLEEGTFSQRVSDMIRWCLSPDPEQRPDIVAVSARISDLMMRLMDGLYASQNALQRRADRDRKRAQKYFLEVHKGRAEPQGTLEPAAGVSCEQSSSEDGDVRPQETNMAVCPGGLCRLKSTLEQPPSCDDFAAAAKIQPRPVSAGLCVSQKKLRQIHDPIQRLLVQLHKLLFITQLPPTPHHNVQRRLVERFKKSLFHVGSDPFNVKVELSKLLQASPELLDLDSPAPDLWPLVQHLTADSHTADDQSLRDGVTYQQLQGVIEELLQESGYYESTHSRISKQRNEEFKFWKTHFKLSVFLKASSQNVSS